MAMILYPESETMRPIHGGDRVFICSVSDGIPEVGDIVFVCYIPYKIIWLERFVKTFMNIPGERFAIEVLVTHEDGGVE